MSNTPDFWKLANAAEPTKAAKSTKASPGKDRGKSEGKSKLKSSQVLGVSGGAVLLLAIVGLGAWWLGRTKVPPLDAAPAQIVQFAATDKFATMTLAEKKPFVEKMDGQFFRDRSAFEGLTDEQRREGFRNLMESNMDLRMAKFYTLKGKERDAYLDQQLDEMAKRMANRPTTRPTARPAGAGGPGGGNGQRGAGGRGRGMSAQQQKERTESRDSAKGAMRSEMMAAMRKRAEERGMPLPGRGGPGGGGGGRGWGGGGRG